MPVFGAVVIRRAECDKMAESPCHYVILTFKILAAICTSEHTGKLPSYTWLFSQHELLHG